MTGRNLRINFYHTLCALKLIAYETIIEIYWRETNDKKVERSRDRADKSV